MLNISLGEFFVFAIIALIVLGPDKLPQTIKAVLLKYRNLRQALDKIQHDFENELELAELKQLMHDELARIKKNEDDLKAQLLQMQVEIDHFHQDSILADTVKTIPSRYIYHDAFDLHIPYQNAEKNPDSEVKKVA